MVAQSKALHSFPNAYAKLSIVPLMAISDAIMFDRLMRRTLMPEQIEHYWTFNWNLIERKHFACQA